MSINEGINEQFGYLHYNRVKDKEHDLVPSHRCFAVTIRSRSTPSTTLAAASCAVYDRCGQVESQNGEEWEKQNQNEIDNVATPAFYIGDIFWVVSRDLDCAIRCLITACN